MPWDRSADKEDQSKKKALRSELQNMILLECYLLLSSKKELGGYLHKTGIYFLQLNKKEVQKAAQDSVVRASKGGMKVGGIEDPLLKGPFLRMIPQTL